MTKKVPVGILISGRGTNLKALIEASRATDYPAQIKLVISNRPKARGIAIAKAAGIDVEIIDHTTFESRSTFDAALTNALKNAGIELICNAGFTRLLTKTFVETWHNRQLNIHPSLLPSFKGLNTHARALKRGVKITGCTVHFVRNEMDTGPIIAQAAIEVHKNDTPDTLKARVQKAEHRLYPEALRLIASGDVKLVGNRVIASNIPANETPLYAPRLS